MVDRFGKWLLELSLNDGDGIMNCDRAAAKIVYVQFAVKVRENGVRSSCYTKTCISKQVSPCNNTYPQQLSSRLLSPWS